MILEAQVRTPKRGTRGCWRWPRGCGRLRRHVGRPLPELVTEVERALGLDVEVAARPGSSQAVARADLDAFADAAAAFAGDAQEPPLGAFLAYLTAAETEEFGLEAGQISDTDAVKLATVHSAKGLQWPAVVCARAGSRDARAELPGQAPADHAVD